MRNLILFIFYFFSIFSLSLAEKKSIDVEEELKEEKSSLNKEKKKIKDTKILIEGEDEYTIKNQKEEFTDILPELKVDYEWEEKNDQIVKRDKKRTKSIERGVQIRVEYGSFHTMDIDFHLTKKDKYATYLLEYYRSKQDYEANTERINNSESSTDNLKFISGFDIGNYYKIFLKAIYQDNFYGLQKNRFFSKQSKKGGILELLNVIRPTASQKINFSVSGEYISSNLKENKNSTYGKGLSKISWENNIGINNTIYLGGSFWYGENNSYEKIKKVYNIGDFVIWDLFTLFRTYVGKEKKRWQLNVKLGFKSYFGEGFSPFFGPLVEFDHFLGFWVSKLLLERVTEIPNYFGVFFERPYTVSKNYDTPEDRWTATWRNKLRFAENKNLQIIAGFHYYSIYYNPTLNKDEFYTYTAKLFRVTFTEISWQQSIKKLLGNLSYNLKAGLKLEHHLDNINFKSPVLFSFKNSLVSSIVDLHVEVVFIGSRFLEKQKLKEFVLLSTVVEAKITSSFIIFAKGENLLNTSYQLTPPYQNSGIKISGGINFFI